MKTNDKVCKAVFKDLQGNVRGLFSTEHILTCFNSESYSRYCEILGNENIKTIFDDKEMMKTIQQLFENNLNISQTSQKAFMHRNTLNYRIEKVNKLIGLNLKSFEDAIIFSNLMTIRKFFH